MLGGGASPQPLSKGEGLAGSDCIILMSKIPWFAYLLLDGDFADLLIRFEVVIKV